MGYFNFFPNMYVVLVSPPGRCRKSVAINTASNLAKDLSDVIISADSTTREALILELDRSSRIIDLNGVPYTHSSVTIISKELSVFLGVGNHDLLSLLTDLYDCPSKWEYKTKNKGINTVHGVWLNMLAASTPTWLIGSIPVTAIGTGFTSRVIFVVEEDVRFKNYRPKLTQRELRLRDELSVMLEQISMMKGEFNFSPAADEFLQQWYDSENTKSEDPRFAGYYERKQAHLIKVSMIVAASDMSEGVIEKHHVQNALKLLNDAEVNMVKAFGAVGRSTIAADIDEILNMIVDAEIIERGQLIKATRMNVHPREFDNIIGLLKAGGDIEEIVKNGKVFYTFKQSASLDELSR